MIDLPDLPVFDIPAGLKRSRPPNIVVFDWINDNIRELKESGQMEIIRKQSSRQPVDVRFKL